MRGLNTNKPRNVKNTFWRLNVPDKSVKTSGKDNDLMS